MNKNKPIITSTGRYNSAVVSKKEVLSKCGKFLVTGIVVDEDGEGISGAIISIIKVDKSWFKVKKYLIGYCIADNKGNYEVLLDKKENIDYILKVYQPMIND